MASIWEWRWPLAKKNRDVTSLHPGVPHEVCEQHGMGDQLKSSLRSKGSVWNYISHTPQRFLGIRGLAEINRTWLLRTVPCWIIFSHASEEKKKNQQLGFKFPAMVCEAWQQFPWYRSKKQQLLPLPTLWLGMQKLYELEPGQHFIPWSVVVAFTITTTITFTTFIERLLDVRP